MYEQNNFAMGFSQPQTNVAGFRPGIGKDEKEKVDEKREKTKLEIIQPDEFPSTFRSGLITTMDLCKKINAMFKSAVSDYWGSTILPNPSTGQLELVIYLKDLGNSDKIKLIQPVTNINKNSSIMNRLTSLNNRQLGKTIELTQDGKDIFEDFVIRNNGKVNWKQHTVEVTEAISTYQTNKYNIYLKVFNLDLPSVLKTLWGSRGENGESYSYSINYIRPVSQQNHIIEVKNYDNRAIEALAEKVGLIPTVGNFGIVR